MWQFVTAPLQYAFMQRGLMAAVLVGIICSVIGCYIVLRSDGFPEMRWRMLFCRSRHRLPGKGNLLVGGLAAAVIVALGIGYLSRGGAVKEDTAIGILFAAALSLGIALISSMQGYAGDLLHILFGNVLGVNQPDLVLTAVLGVVVLMTILLLFKEFLVISFDRFLPRHCVIRCLTAESPAGAAGSDDCHRPADSRCRSGGCPPGDPAATAYLLTRRLAAMMLVAAVFGSGFSGRRFIPSYYVNIASGAAIVLVCTFFLSWCFCSRRIMGSPFAFCSVCGPNDTRRPIICFMLSK